MLYDDPRACATTLARAQRPRFRASLGWRWAVSREAPAALSRWPSTRRVSADRAHTTGQRRKYVYRTPRGRAQKRRHDSGSVEEVRGARVSPGRFAPVGNLIFAAERAHPNQLAQRGLMNIVECPARALGGWWPNAREMCRILLFLPSHRHRLRAVSVCRGPHLCRRARGSRSAS